MSRKTSLWLLLATSLLLASGCATGRNYQSDIDALNARVSALQGELAAKDQEIARLQGRMSEQQSALVQAETDKRLLSEKLDTALRQLESKPQKAEPAPRPESDLK